MTSSEEESLQLEDMLSRYFAEKAQKEIDKLWEDGTINNAVVEGWKMEQMRMKKA